MYSKQLLNWLLNQGVLIAGLSILKAWFAGLIKLRTKGLALWSIFYSHKVHLDWLLQIQGLLIVVKWCRLTPNFYFNISFQAQRSELNWDNVRKISQPVIVIDIFDIPTIRSMTGSQNISSVIICAYYEVLSQAAQLSLHFLLRKIRSVAPSMKQDLTDAV